MSTVHLTDRALFDAAVDLAQQRARLLRAADQGHASLSRRQCQLRAREREARIVNLSITAELRCEREARAVS